MMREAADILSSDASMQIRYLETIAKLGLSSKVVFIGDEEWNKNQKTKKKNYKIFFFFLFFKLLILFYFFFF